MQLGITVRDTITNFQGVVLGHCSYLTGCDQALVQPVSKPKEDGSPCDTRIEPQWFDTQRLVKVEGFAQVTLDNRATPGCDRAAPKI